MCRHRKWHRVRHLSHSEDDTEISQRVTTLISTSHSSDYKALQMVNQYSSGTEAENVQTFVFCPIKVQAKNPFVQYVCHVLCLLHKTIKAGSSAQH